MSRAFGVTEIAFHFNAPDKLAYACRFARKALRHGARLVILGPESVLQPLDGMLWSLQPQDFLAHCREDAASELLQASPIVLVSTLNRAPHQEVLLNLGAVVPEGFERFARVIEVVSAEDAEDRQQARLRWRHYAARGYDIVRHDLVLRGE